MTPAENLWDAVRVYFDTDDGMLPDIVIAGLAPDEVQLVFKVLQRHAADDALVGRTTWLPERDAEVPILSIDAPGLAAATGRLPTLHTLFTGLRVDGAEIPDLGAYFEADAVALDYRQGAHWGPVTLGAFADLLGLIAESCEAATFDPYGEIQSSRPPNFAFRAALQRYWDDSRSD